MGEVGKPHGLSGEVMVVVHSEDPARFKAGAALLVGPRSDQTKQMRIAQSRPSRDGMLVRFEGIEDRDRAGKLRGKLIFVSAAALGPLEADAFWEHEIVGSLVTDRAGRPIGTLVRVLPRPEQDLWEVASAASTLLIPAAKDIVVSVDVDAKRIVVDPPAGLIDDAS